MAADRQQPSVTEEYKKLRVEYSQLLNSYNVAIKELQEVKAELEKLQISAAAKKAAPKRAVPRVDE